MTASRTPIGRLLDLAFPAVCPGCGAEGPPICARCLPRRPRPRAAAARHAVRARRGAAGAAAPARVVRAVRRRRAPGPPRAEVRRRAAARGAARRGRRAPAGARAGAGGDVLVPVPVHESRRRERGYDQAALHRRASPPARCACRPSQAVVRTRATEAQYRLDRRHRAANVRDAFARRAGGTADGRRPLGRPRRRRRDDRRDAARGGRRAPRRRRGRGQRGHGGPRAMSRLDAAR